LKLSKGRLNFGNVDLKILVIVTVGDLLSQWFAQDLENALVPFSESIAAKKRFTAE